MTTFNRRTFLKSTAAVAGVSALSMPFISTAHAADPLKVGTYGGYFQSSFEKHIFPDFTKATGIEVESIGEPTGEAWLVQLEAAARADQAPADVSMIAQVAHIKGQKSKLWAPLDKSKLPNMENLQKNFINHYDNGDVSGIGAVAWYITLVTNTDEYGTAPTSWKDLWDPKNKDKLGLMALATNSFMLDITAKTWFGGNEILNSEEGIMKVMDKISELKDNVNLWYRDEGQFQQALEVGEVPMGQYYHDVAGLAASDGKPVRSTFPVEGGVLDSGSWCVSKASKRIEDSHTFINYMCQPSVQAKLSRFVGTSPTVHRNLLDLTDAEFSSVSSEIEPIIPHYQLYDQRSDWVNQKWSELIAG